MAEAKHTPGPWRVVVKHYGEGRELDIIGESGKQIARLYPANHFDDYDAPLMATAPLLLEALVEMWEAHAGNTSGSMSKKVLDAIAKATGQT